MKEVKDGDDIDRKIRAFWFPPYDGAYIKLNGTKYSLANSFILASLNRSDLVQVNNRPLKAIEKTVSSSWPNFSLAEAEAVSDVLLSNKVNYWTGHECREFETEFAAFTGSRYAVAVSNGTVALDLALIALGVGKGDEVIVTSRTFVASASCIVNAGATPVFADVSKDSQNITAETISRVISDRTKAILCVHFSGLPCDMDPIMDKARQHKLFVIEDCAQAHGAKYKGRSVGSIGHVGAWSFCQDKIISTGGEGGMVTTNDEELWSRMWSYKDHGKSWQAVYDREHKSGFRWLHESFGTNWRMTEMQRSDAFRYSTAWNMTRMRNANAIWDAAFRCERLRVPISTCATCKKECSQIAACIHAAYKCYVFVEGTEADRDAIMAEINSEGVHCLSGSCSEVYLEKAFYNAGLQPPSRLPNAKKLGETSLMFQCHPMITEEEIQKTCDVLVKVVTNYFD